MATKFKRVGQMVIRPLLMQKGTPAFDLARMFYAQYPDLCFEKDLVEYMRQGFVVVRPHLFCLARPILHEGEQIWYLRMVIGDLMEAISCLPFWLDKVAYCRNNQADKMVVGDTKRMIELSKRKAA